MATLGVAAAAGAAATGGGLFSYNRKNFLFDRDQRQKNEYTIMEFRIKQAGLWREDVRDVIGLTSIKMDTYIVVTAVQLGMVVMAFCEGRLTPDVPSWLVGCHTLSIAGAFMYLLMALWLAIHASVAARGYEVRLLTQHVRLPVPSWVQLEGARTYASAFENAESKQMFRLPFVQGTQESVKQKDEGVPAPVPESSETEGAAEGEAEDAGTGDPWGLEGRGDDIYELSPKVRENPESLRHIKLTRQALQYWQAHDSFARVCMSLGASQLVTTLSYYMLGYILVADHGVIASFCGIALFTTIAVGLLKLDMTLTKHEFRVAAALVSLGPLLAAVATQQFAAGGEYLVALLVPIVYAIHAMWFLFLLHICRAQEQKGGSILPTGFRSVLYLDVFGWISQKDTSDAPRRGLATYLSTTLANMLLPSAQTGANPAIQSVTYGPDGRPVPTRPEKLDGAAVPASSARVLDPASFVPKEQEAEESFEEIESGLRNPGSAPWRVFSNATFLLAGIWWLAGIFVLLQCFGIDGFDVAPLLGFRPQGQFVGLHGYQSSTQLVGEVMPTAWPHGNVHPSFLACDAETRTLVASSRFGIFKAHFSEHSDAAHAMVSKSNFVTFEKAPACDGLDGDVPQDLAVRCTGADCKVHVLHHNGRKLTTCALDAEKHSHFWQHSSLATSSVSDAWLGANGGSTNERVTSFILGRDCHQGGYDCAFAETSGNRIVELRAESSGRWLPSRILRSKMAGDLGSSLHLIHGGLLAEVRKDQHRVTHLEVMDPRNGASPVGKWVLPKDKQWVATCSAGDHLFAVAQGASPEVYRFGLPEQLKNLAQNTEFVAPKASGVSDKGGPAGRGQSKQMSRAHPQ